MFGIDTFEFLVIILVAVLVLGPEHLPRVMRIVAKVTSDFRRISTEFQRAINLEANKEEFRQKHGEDAFKTANKALKPKKKGTTKKKKAAAKAGPSSPDAPQAGTPPGAVEVQTDTQAVTAAAASSGIASASLAQTASETPSSGRAAHALEPGVVSASAATARPGTLGDLPEAALEAATPPAGETPGSQDSPHILPGGTPSDASAQAAGAARSAAAPSLPEIDFTSLPVQGGRA